VKQDIRRIMVALGGEDARGNLPSLLASLLPLLREPVDICVPGAHPVAIRLPDHVTLTWEWLKQDALARRMAEFDLAILAGGTMLWQAACVGVPTISWPQTQGQKGHATAWKRQGALIVIKSLNDLPAAWAWLQSPDSRQQLSRAGRGLIDGLGASRIAACLQSMSEELPCA
jgi:UDP-2,4-diacetamido-2,4,6-trideoxy-beta-L-altropyranose hydrolase